ncbi:MFS transporter [Geodermatophilus obscurus]|uniref:Major facilitator superfamily MFS_1 n=1 Tax=Geodermatophilus obscurus (strain ATCC 25078 / DSM 43160 / JCM 3152 / CCUG 61914 / KCC A-0152 / KCTC 9177 / NBRC 13315 / NRRL B-3577 / G-20) TaxID=526225 RepID=D2S6G7_GEOOG|nr:MFS transporter [Geodermatophilus obscurus]ADB75341.1 major facilitator superfamily MFS_1 [Geodermatophilus obscurus DSM 43160]
MTTAATTGPTSPPADVALRRERFGWYSYDWAMSVFNTSITTVFLGPYLTSVAEEAAGPDGRLGFLGLSIPPGSWFSYVLSASVLLQVLVLPLTGAVADRRGRKREMLAGFAALGALATTALYFVADGRYLLGALLFILANISFGAATVVYYSWLPDLAGPDERDAVSSRGWAFGYVGGALLLAVHLGLVLGAPSLGLTTGEAVRICLATAGLWWGAFTVFSVSRLRNRPVREAAGRPRSGFRQLATTMREMRAFPLTLWFLGAYLLFNDGVQTVISLSATYATEELGLEQSVLTGAILMVQVVAIAGALGLGRLAGRYGARRVVLGALVAWIGVLVAAFSLRAGAVGQFYALAAVIGLVQGGTQALSRSLFSQLIPAGKEAEYYGFYEISDRGTSWLGPLAFGLTYQLTGSYRLAIVSLVVFFVAGFVALATLPIRRAVVAAGNTPPERL